jgi:prepilin-type N-terminal cleavage/methylation domain-containing protein
MSGTHASLRSPSPRNTVVGRGVFGRHPSRLSGTGGFTLVELIIAMALSLVVFTAVGAALISGAHDEATITGRSAQLQQAELAIQRLVRNLREATSVTLTSTSAITYAMPVSTGSESVTFSCSAVTETCTQTIGSVHTTEVTGVANTNIFTGTPSTSPTYIGVSLTLAAKGEIDVTVSDGAGLRNL